MNAHYFPGRGGDVCRIHGGAAKQVREKAAVRARADEPAAQATGIAHKLQRHGYGMVKNPKASSLEESHGPLRAGKIQGAKEWGAQQVRAERRQRRRLGDLGQMGQRVGQVVPQTIDGPRWPRIFLTWSATQAS